MKADYHVHCEFSDDSIYPMEEVVRDAIALGLDEICFTDHVDYGIKEDWDSGAKITCRGKESLANVNYPVYFEKIKEMQEKYGDKITIKKGLELGVQSHTIGQFEALTKKYPLDFAILSIHQVRDLEFWTGDFQKGRSQKEYNDEYYGEMLRVVRQFKDYSVLGHLDLIVRYDPAGIYPFEKEKEIITEILKQVISDGKGIELNTSSVRYGLKDSQPGRDILKLYRELGGKIITIGSDSHKKEHLGAYIDEAKALLRELGYEQFCTYEDGKPVFHSLA